MSTRKAKLVLLGLSWLCVVQQLPPAQAEYVQYMEISENAPPGTRVGFIEAESSSPPYLVVSVPGSRADSDLLIDSGSGEIRTRVALDREVRDSYSLVALPQNVRVLIRVLDENDNVPNFPVDEVHLEFSENSPRDSKRPLPPAKDLDLGCYSTQRYDIVAGNDNEAFRLTSQRGRDGVLYLDLQNVRTLDREVCASYHLLVEASDGGDPPLRSWLRVNVLVQDVNDNPPMWAQLRYSVHLAENASIGTSVLQVSATDADLGDNGHVEYSINRRQSDREHVFHIEPETGLVVLDKSLDFELRQRHELVLVARDRGVRPLEASAFLTVHVVDVNDNQPVIMLTFLSNDATPKVSETATEGELVARVLVSDPDSRAEYANASVSLSGGEGHFGLTSRDNVIYLVVVERPLDREVTPAYELVLEATDSGNPPLRATRSFRLLVTDVNDNVPRFTQQFYETNLLEISEPGTSLIRVHANDPDEGLNAQVRYALINSTGVFAIDSHSGVITNLVHIDCERDPSPRLLVVASDLGTPTLSATAIVQMIIHDLNNNEPVFDRPFYNLSLSEDLPPGHCFIKVRASDSDCGVNAMVNYTFLPTTSPTEQFLIHSNTGDICVRTTLDRETRAYYELLIVAADKGGLSTTTIVYVFIIDVNDNQPEFHPREYNVTLRTDVPMSGVILKCIAIDADTGIFGQIHYRISDDNGAEIFAIDRISGEIYIVRPKYLKKSSAYLLNVTATDSAGLKSTHDAIVRIFTSSHGQESANCGRSTYSFSVKENLAQNTFIGSVRDTRVLLNTGNTSEQFHLIHEDSKISLEVGSGTIRTELPLDRETCDRYFLSVEVRNVFSVGYCQVEIIVEDVNDNPPLLASNSVRISIAESYPIKTSLYIVHAIDIDITPTKPIRFDLSQDNNELFRINTESGEVYLVHTLDYEKQQLHRLVVTAFDGAGLSANLSLDIQVQDVNDNPPIFDRNEYYVEVAENLRIGTQIVQMMATDLDSGKNARLNYQLEENTGTFRINPNSGWISLSGPLDREYLDRYSFTVKVKDNGLPAARSNATLVVNILDVNDNEPHFGKEFYVFEILENLPAGVYVGTVCATDIDLGYNALIKYSIVQSNSSFTVDPNTGEIRARHTLDREAITIYDLIIEARDKGTPSQAARVPVKINVLDVNDNSPEIIDPQDDVVSVREEQVPGTEVVRVKALDNDFSENASITYSILNANSMTNSASLVSMKS